MHFADDDDDDDDKFPRSRVRARAHRGRVHVRCDVRVSIIYSEWDARRAAQSRAEPDFPPFPSREIVSRISAAIRGEARRGGVRACIRTYDSTLLNEGGRYSRFVETSLSEIGSPLSAFMGQKKRFTSGKLDFYASLDSGCNSSIINTRLCNFNRTLV